MRTPKGKSEKTTFIGIITKLGVHIKPLALFQKVSSTLFVLVSCQRWMQIQQLPQKNLFSQVFLYHLADKLLRQRLRTFTYIESAWELNHLDSMPTNHGEVSYSCKPGSRIPALVREGREFCRAPLSLWRNFPYGDFQKSRPFQNILGNEGHQGLSFLAP